MPPLTDDPVGHLLGALGVDVGDHHGHALAGERLGVGLPMLLPAPVTMATFVVELSHSWSSFLTSNVESLSTIRPDERNN